MNVAYITKDIEDYQTFFSNKKTGKSFSLSERCTHICDKDKGYHPPDECEWKSWKDDKLSAFRSHIDAVIKFFDKKKGLMLIMFYIIMDLETDL